METKTAAPEFRGSYLKAPRSRASDDPQVALRVTEIIESIREGGWDAVRRWSRDLDDWDPAEYLVSDAEREAAVDSLPDDLAADIDYALGQVRTFARHQLDCLRPLDVEMHPGIRLGHRLLPIRSVGAYVPGGRYPLIASAFMTIAVAKTAGVSQITAVAPPTPAGGLHQAQLAAMHLSGADHIFALGGVQALTALALGVGELAPAVDMIVGAGNPYVTEAKRQLFGEVGIEALAGPSELTILADSSADPVLLTYDLLGQAEHGPTSEVILVTTDEAVGRAVLGEIPRQLANLPTAATAGAAWEDRGAVILCDDAESAIETVNYLAPEHLEVQTGDVDWWFARLNAYGTVFLGSDATVAYSDKAIGTNNVLPTGRASRYTGGLWVGSFLRVLTHQRIKPEAAVPVAEATVAIARAEGLEGHARSAEVRLHAPATPTNHRGEQS